MGVYARFLLSLTQGTWWGCQFHCKMSIKLAWKANLIYTFHFLIWYSRFLVFNNKCNVFKVSPLKEQITQLQCLVLKTYYIQFWFWQTLLVNHYNTCIYDWSFWALNMQIKYDFYVPPTDPPVFFRDGEFGKSCETILGSCSRPFKIPKSYFFTTFFATANFPDSPTW